MAGVLDKEFILFIIIINTADAIKLLQKLHRISICFPDYVDAGTQIL